MAKRSGTPAQTGAPSTHAAGVPSTREAADPEGADGADEALLRLIRLCLSATLRAGAAAQPPLSPTQVRTLTVIAGAPEGLSVTAVAEAISASNPSASRLCQRLVRDGLLHRDAGPGNELRMSLSPHGRRTLDAVDRDRAAALRSLLEALPPAKQRRASTALADLTAHL